MKRKPALSGNAVRSDQRAPRAYATLEGVGRALRILEAIAERPMRANELATALGLKWTTAYRTLTHLLEEGYLRRDDETGIYSVGRRLYALGQSYLFDHPVVAAGAQTLRAVAKDLGVSAQLNERQEFQAITLFAVDHKLEVIPKTTPEFHFPLHTGSKGQVLLAYSDREIIDAVLARPLVALTEKSITNPEVLRTRLDDIRAQGYAVTREDVQPGTGSAAAPIFDPQGGLAGAVCFIVWAREMSPDRVSQLVDHVCGTARGISAQLGRRRRSTEARM